MRKGGGHLGSLRPRYLMVRRVIQENYSVVTGGGGDGGASIQVEVRVTGGGRDARVVAKAGRARGESDRSSWHLAPSWGWWSARVNGGMGLGPEIVV